MTRMAGTSLMASLAVATPVAGGGLVEGFLIDGEVISLEEVKRGYQMGDHIVDGGPGNLFWASNIQSTPTLQPKPLEHGLEVLSRHRASRLSRQQVGQRFSTQAARTTPSTNGGAVGATGITSLIGLIPADSRDYRMPDGVMRSALLPLGMSIDTAIRKGLWS